MFFFVRVFVGDDFTVRYAKELPARKTFITFISVNSELNGNYVYWKQKNGQDILL